MRTLNDLRHRLTENHIWTSVFRQGYPDTPIDQSLVMTNTLLLHLNPVKVKRHTLKITYTWGLGLMAFWLFAVLVGTGVLLMFFYVPSPERAYSDISSLETSVTMGMLLRNLHRWSAHAMVLMVFLHMCRVFYTGSYKPPREFNWVIGVLLFVLTLLLSFTGYLLPWDQLSFWAITVGTNIAGYAPLVGEQMRMFLLGSKEVGSEALIRFYALHIAVLPLALTILISVHFWRIRKDGGLSAPANETSRERASRADWVN